MYYPPLSMQTAQQPMTCEAPESEAPPSDDLNDKEDSIIPDTNDDDLDTDYENDQNLHHSLVGHKIKTIYDNG